MYSHYDTVPHLLKALPPSPSHSQGLFFASVSRKRRRTDHPLSDLVSCSAAATQS